jgi:hypothetical protein
MPDVVQFYETEVADRESGLTASFIVVPSSALGYQPDEPPGGLIDIIDLLNSEAAALSYYLWAVVTSDTVEEAMQKIGGTLLPSPLPDEERAFFDSLAYSAVVPTEQSPLDKESLAELLSAASQASRRWTVGAAIALGAVSGRPLLLLYVPAGIILIGAARGIAEALHVGLRERILDRLGVTERKNANG